MVDMNGVEILAMEEIVTDSIFNWSVFWIAFGVIFGSFIVIGIIMSLAFHDWSNVRIGVVIGVILSIVFSPRFGDIIRVPAEYKTQYKVIISDEVSRNEFAEKYEIIEQEGRIYTVAEKE